MNKKPETFVQHIRKFIGHNLLHIPGSRVVILNKKGEVLLQKRSYFNVWGLPGGCVEREETDIELLIREVYEETGLTLLNPKPFGHASNPEFEIIKFPNNDIAHFHVLLFYATEFRGKLKTTDEETIALGWFSPELLPNTLKNMARTVEAYLAYRESKQFQIL